MKKKPRISWIYGKRPGKKMDNEIRICTLNVRKFLKPGGKIELLDILARYRADITALQEIRWKGCDIMTDKTRKVDIYYSCTEECVHFVDFAIRRDHRISVIRVKGIVHNRCIVNAYAPKDGVDGIWKDTFYDHLEIRNTETTMTESFSGSSDARKFYHNVKRQIEWYSPPTAFCNNANGNLLVNDKDILNWIKQKSYEIQIFHRCLFWWKSWIWLHWYE